MSDIDEIKLKLDIADFIGKRVHLKKAGRNLKGLCPFHSERTPSFMVSPDRQSWHCFGCGKGGSVFDFVMEYEHVDFREALEELAEQAGVTLSKQTSLTPQERQKDVLMEIHHLASEYYQYLLMSHSVGEKAREYIKDRGVSEKTMKTFGLGYSPNSWDGISKYLKKKGYDEKVLEESGLLIPSSRGGYDRFRGRLMFPLRNHRGQTIGFAGRLLDPNIKEAKYINSPETSIYKKGEMVFSLDVAKGAVQKEQSVVLMEGEFDVISSFQAGITNCVAIKGTALTEQQVYLLKRFATKIIFALDSDFAGDQASRRGIEIAEKAGLEIHVANLPLGKDPDDVARSEPHLLKQAIAEAQSVYDYYFSSVQKNVDKDSAYGKKRISDELLPIIARIDNAIVQAHYIKKLADVLHIPEQAIHDSLRKIRIKILAPNLLQKEVKEEALQSPDPEVYLLALLLQGKPELLLVEPQLDIETVQSVAVRQILKELKQEVQKTPFLLSTFLESLPEEWRNVIDQAMTWDVAETVELSAQLDREWRRVVRESTRRHLRGTIVALTQELKQKPEEAQEQIARQIDETAQKLRHLEKSAKI